MHRSFLALLLATLSTACLGTGIGNPDARGPAGGGGGGTDTGAGGSGGMGGAGGMGGTGGMGGGSADGDVLPAPQVVDLGTSCPGAVARAWLDLANQSTAPVLVELEADAAIALAPSALELEALGMARVAVLHTAAPEGDAAGTIGIAWQGGTAAVGWTLAVDAERRQRAQVLCGGEGPCEAAILAGPAETVLEAPLGLVNDGCDDLVLTSFEADGAGRLPELVGPPLPATLAPGERYEGILRMEAAGQESGSFRFLLGDEGHTPDLPWSIEVGTTR